MIKRIGYKEIKMCIPFVSAIGGTAAGILIPISPLAIAVANAVFNAAAVHTLINHINATPRPLTPGEATMIISIFKDSIKLALVKVRNGPILPMQRPNTAVTPWGEPYFPKGHFCDDFSIEPIHSQHWFMHEIAHVWQYGLGMSVAIRGIKSEFADYDYQLANDKVLSDYGMEQQASILADYWCLKTHGYKHWYALTREKNMTNINNNAEIKDKRSYWLNQYENTLKLFLQNPEDKKALFG